MKIQNNITAMNANRILGVNKSKTAKALEKLASGYRINRSADDAAGLAVSEKMRSMINGITQAEKNCHDAVSLVQTAEGALNEVHSMLQRMNALANQAANGSYDDGIDRASLQLEFTQIQDEIDHIAEHTDFNGMNLFDGTGGTYKLPSGNTVTKQQKYTAVDASAQQNNVTLESVLSQKSEKLENIIYTETTFNFETTQTQAGSSTNTSPEGWAEAAETLETQIVPQAVQAIMSKYTAFNYLTGSSIGIGLNLYSDSSTTLAYVSASPTAYQNNTTGEVYATAMTYTLSVNMNSVDLSTEEGRSALESTIAHEMIHAFMFEATTAGMFGLSSSGQTDSFPAWFAEGMAQTASGPGNWVHHGMGITPDSDTSEISTALANDPLTSSESNTTAQYGTGYLACMYLGYLASGADANLSSSTAAASDILSGLNTMLSKIISGSSLDSVINEISGGKYSSTSDFENGFANDGDVVSFIQMMALQGYFSTDSTPNDGYTTNVVSGGLISGNLLNGDPYPDDSLSLNLFALDSTNTAVKNEYPSDITVLSGGVVSADGVAPTEDMTPSVTSTGDFTVTGGTYGTDYTYDEDTGTLTVLTGTALTIEGTGSATTDKIKINDGITANVTIKNVNIDLSGTSSVCAFEVGENSTVNLTLEGTNILKSGAHRAGLQVGEGETLIINGDGSLDVTGGTAAAGIGGNNFRLYEADYGSNATSGTIIIDGGIITATGVRAAGIGGGYGGSGGNTTITGGKVSATGSRGGAGIGGGCGTSTSGGSGGNIEISGGKVTATGGENAVAIGDGVNGSGSTFSTTENGNAEITVSNADNDTEIADLISDTSGIDVWSATINGVQYPIAAPAPSTGSFTVTGGTYGTDYTYDADIGTLTVLTDRAITIEGTGSATTDKIKINDGTNANVTIKNVNIDVSSAGGTAAFEVGEGSTVNLTLEGTNILKSGAHRAGLQVGEGETLVIDGNGSLDATGGEAGAGIGGSIYDSGGTIEINGGEVTATGGSSGAGIGGGPNGSGGTIEINGGTVTATGGTDGAGIGGGNDGGGGTVDINGGTVTATGGEWAAGIGGGGGAGGNTGGTINIDGGTVSATGGQGGAGIGGGNNAAGGDVTISGGNVTATGGTATSGNSPEAIGAGGENGSGGTFSTTENGTAVITANVKDADDNIISDPTIEQLISDTSGIDVWSATINGVQYPIAAPAPSTGDFTVTGGTYGTDYTYDEDTGTLTVLTNEAIKIEGTGSATTDKIKIDDGITANVTIKNVNIDVSDTDYACAFEVGENSTVNLTLEGENTLKSGYDCAGLQVGEGEKLVIDGSGSLDATGGEFGAGIGGSDHDSGGTIEIKSGEVTATAGNYAAGIGGGYEGSGGDIDINGGTVTATGGAYAAGIGGGDSGSSGGNIDISGGTVTATGGFEGSGIGGGVGGDGGNIVIGGGNVTATGGDWAAGIGGGNTGDGGKIEISGGTVNATGGEDAVAIGDGKNGSGGTFSTGTNGVAVITANVKDINDDIISDLTIEQLISDTSGIDTWKATINGTQYPIQLQGDGQINLNDVDGPVTITDSGYTIGDTTYVYTGDYTFTGTTDEDITVSSGGTTNITFDGVTGENFTVKGKSTVNLTVTNTSTVDNVTVENGSKLNIVSGTLNVTNKLDNDGTVENSGVLNNSGEIDNDGDITNNSGGKITNANGGTIDNSGDITNNSGGTIVNIIGSDITNNNSGSINNDGLISSSGTISNSGDITNNSGGAIDSAGDINNNSSGAVNNDGEIYNGGTINNSGAVNNDGEIINANGGTIDNSGDITNNNGGTITNNGTGSISNSGDITNNSGGTIINEAIITNNNGGTIDNSGTLTNTDSGSISNSGDITNKSGGTVENAGSVTNNNGGTIDNSGTITNSGEITNADGGTIDNSGDIDSTGGTLTNNGEIKSRPDSNIDGTVGGANQPVDAPAKADDDDDKDGDFEDGENIWIMQVGGRSKDTFAMDIGRMNTKILGVDKDSVNISTQASANAAIDKIGEAVNKLSRQRADIGAYQNRLEHKIDNLNVTRENLISAESKIRDTDMAVYMMEFTKNQILNNAAQAMLAQANSLPQSVLSLVQ